MSQHEPTDEREELGRSVDSVALSKTRRVVEQIRDDPCQCWVHKNKIVSRTDLGASVAGKALAELYHDGEIEYTHGSVRNHRKYKVPDK